jgi:hypothetical protein
VSQVLSVQRFLGGWFVVLALSGCAQLRGGGAGVQTETIARFPRDAARFAIEPLTDSTFAFTPDEAKWVAPGLTGIAVDPGRGDALVAKVRVVSVDSVRANAFVTGQTTRIASGQVLLLVPPKRAWWRERVFWLGALSGGLLSGAVFAWL